MEHEKPLEEKRDSIRKAIANLQGFIDPCLSQIKVGLERAYLSLYRRGIASVDHSARKYSQRTM